MTTTLLITLVVCYIAQCLLAGFKTDDWVMRWLALSKEGLAHGKVYQLLTFQFLHGGIMHLLMNMLVLYFFGRAVEEMLGSQGMLKLYLASGVVGGLLQVGLSFAFPRIFYSAVVGASAGIFGLIAAFATRSPDQPILIFFFLPVKAKVILMVEGGMAIAGVLGPLLPHPLFTSDIAHAAHLGGMLTGLAWIKWGIMERPSLNFWRRDPRPEPVRATAKRAGRNSTRKNEEIPPAEFISREVDPILEKISAHGIHSLTERERQILEAARSKMAKR